MLSAERKLCGQVSAAPREVPAQRWARIRAPMLPPPLRNSSVLLEPTTTGEGPLDFAAVASGGKGSTDMSHPKGKVSKCLLLLAEMAVGEVLQRSGSENSPFNARALVALDALRASAPVSIEFAQVDAARRVPKQREQRYRGRG